MSRALHLLVSDLHRLAPWIFLHAAFLIGRALTFDGEQLRGSNLFPILAQELALVALLGALVAEHPTFQRRAFWRTLPIDGGTLLAARVMFVALALWLPRAFAQLLAFDAIGLDAGALWRRVAIDVVLSQALWVGTLFALIGFCRRTVQWVFVPLVGAFLLGLVQRTLRFPIQWRTTDPMGGFFLAQGVLTLGLIAALAILLVAVYQRRPSWVGAAVLVALLASLLPVPITRAVVEDHRELEPPAAPRNLSFRIEGSEMPISTYNRRRIVWADLQPLHLEPTLGLRVTGLEAVLTAEDGTILRSPEASLLRPCRFSQATLEQLVSSDDTHHPFRCGTGLTVPLFDVTQFLRSRVESLTGSLELKLQVEVFSERMESTELTTGATLGDDLVRVAIDRIETFQGESPTTHQVQLLYFAPPMGRRQLDTPSPSLALLDPERRHLVNASDSFGSHGGPYPLLFWYSRLHLGHGSLTVDADEAGALSHDGSLPLHLLWHRHSDSEPFEVTLRIDDFRVADLLR